VVRKLLFFEGEGERGRMRGKEREEGGGEGGGKEREEGGGGVLALSCCSTFTVAIDAVNLLMRIERMS